MTADTGTTERSEEPAHRHKLVLLTWLGTYPAITLVVWLLLPALLERLPLPATTLILSAIVVPIVSYVTVPLLRRAFGPWLGEAPVRTDAGGPASDRPSPELSGGRAGGEEAPEGGAARTAQPARDPRQLASASRS